MPLGAARSRHVAFNYGLATARRHRFIGLLDGRVVSSSSWAEIAGAGLIRLSTRMPKETVDVA